MGYAEKITLGVEPDGRPRGETIITDSSGEGKPLKAHLHRGDFGLSWSVEDYGEPSGGETGVCIASLDYYKGQLRVLVWGDVNQDKPTAIIPLDGAKTELHKKS